MSDPLLEVRSILIPLFVSPFAALLPKPALVKSGCYYRCELSVVQLSSPHLIHRMVHV